MPFGAFIRKRREEKGIQMNDFSRQLEISPAYWSRIERDMEKPPKDELIRKAAEILGISADDAFARRFDEVLRKHNSGEYVKQ